MHKEHHETSPSVLAGSLPAGDITSIVPTVTITVDEYRELAKSKAIADALTALIHTQNSRYTGLTLDEIKILDALFGEQEEE